MSKSAPPPQPTRDIARQPTAPPPRPTPPPTEPEAKEPELERFGPPEKPPASAITTASGISYEIILDEDSTGATPTVNDEVTFSWREWDGPTGNVADSPDRRAIVGTLSSGFQEPLQLLKVGQTGNFWIPASMVPNSTTPVIREIELTGVFPVQPAPPDVAAPPKNARRLGRKGLRYKVLARGKGTVRAKKNDRVTVHYSGWTTDGKMFDSSHTRGRPATFKPSQVIEGWTLALQKMRAGDRWRVWIPEALAYQGKPNRPAGMLVFDIEVIGVEKQPPPPKTPRDVRRPPRRAKATNSGVRYRFLGARKPNGARPNADSRVKVHYSGWTTDGKLFDSSVTRGRPATFPLSGVIPGWRDGILEMRVGEKMRMWIPEELAYQGKPGAPQGMLVFDVELLSIE